MIPRTAAKTLLSLARVNPVVVVTGPRQSGKTTLTRHVFPHHSYVSLENPDHLEFATSDPRGFLAQYSDGAIFDEVQRAPLLFSYIQGIVDEAKKMGMFILTGSRQFGLIAEITQTLAGRAGILELWPFSTEELLPARLLQENYSEHIFYGGYPAIYDRNLDPIQMYDDYIQTYVERDLRQIKEIRNLSQFRTFIKLCAGRIGQILDVANLADDCGVSPHTAESWLSILEASYIIFRLRPHFKNFSKRMIKRPKLYFVDTGLACRLLGLRKHEEVFIHPLRGGLFESMVVANFKKAIQNRKMGIECYFWRDQKGLEIDLVLDMGLKLTAIEIKSSQTISNSLLASLQKFESLAGSSIGGQILVYGGNTPSERMGIKVEPWDQTSIDIDA